MKKAALLFSTLLFLTSVLTCSKNEPESDATTSASTTYVADPNMPLPPQSDAYTVLGVVNGLKEFVVQYDENLFRGGEPYSNDAVTEFKKMGITTILCITPSEVSRFRANLYGFKLVELPFASSTGPSATILNRFFQAISHQNEKFYLHAEGSTYRAGILGMAYRIYVQNWKPEKAINEFAQLGGNVAESESMIQHVLTYKNQAGDL